MMSVISHFIVPVIIGGIFLYGLCRGVNTFDAFLEGAAEGLRTAASIAPASGTRDAGTGRGKQQLQRDLEANLKQMEQAMTKFLGERPRGPRLPGGHL